MKDVLVCDKLECPKCGSHNFWKEDALEGLYICANTVNNEACCGEVAGAYCSECKLLRPFSKYGKHMDVYECKICGRVNWPLTDFIREQEERNKKLEDAIKRSDALIAQLAQRSREPLSWEEIFQSMGSENDQSNIF